MHKLTNRHLWMWVHFLGSCAVFGLVLGLFWHIDWVSVGGAYDGSVQNGLDVVVRLSSAYTSVVNAYPLLLPVHSFLNLIFADMPSDAMWLNTFALGLDVVIWFNILLYIVQLMLFVPSWFMSFLEGKVKDGAGRF